MKHLGCLDEACLQAGRVLQTLRLSADTWQGRHEIRGRELVTSGTAGAYTLMIVEGWADIVVVMDQCGPGS
eukprot:5613307-Pyramimonas_sp.AAC.1